MSEEHAPKIIESKFNRQRAGADTNTLRSRCKEGFIFSKSIPDPTNPTSILKVISSLQSAFHHILPIETLQDARIKPTDEEHMTYIHNSMAATEWDINDTPNLIGLPLKNAYESADRVLVQQAATLTDLLGINPSNGEFGAIPDLPCHQVEHSTYNDGVADYLVEHIWSKLKAESPCKDKSENIAKRLNSAIRTWKRWLKARGSGSDSGGKGAAYSWVNRASLENTWYIPFSMNPGTPRKAPIPPPIPGEQQKDWLAKIFTG